jgi:hypothetical protein
LEIKGLNREVTRSWWCWRLVIWGRSGSRLHGKEFADMAWLLWLWLLLLLLLMLLLLLP